ncbi:glycoside hydrolase family 130 protein [candidate division KSB1 bacterium]|nr:glycoside hydrolase family 130 protein [candidate division KSB1 bacterium]
MATRLIGELKSSAVISRHRKNPVLKASDVPYPAALIFNAGVAKYEGKYVMVFRNDYGSIEEQRIDGTNLGLAFSDDGVKWQVEPNPCWELKTDEITRIYDPRLTVIEGRCYLCFAVDTYHGVCGGVAVTEDFQKFEILSISAPENRNMVLFPEKINGMYLRLERPFPVYGRVQDEWFDIWISDSPDLKYWGHSQLLLAVEHVPFANAKIGPAAPPVKTKHGWLTVFHSVDKDYSRGKNGWEDKWQKRYCAGIMLLDQDNPYKIKGICPEPLIAPEAPYEISGGFRNNAVFPCGMVLEDDGEVKIYYGAADITTCLVTADVDDLIGLCKKPDFKVPMNFGL